MNIRTRSPEQQDDTPQIGNLGLPDSPEEPIDPDVYLYRERKPTKEERQQRDRERDANEPHRLN